MSEHNGMNIVWLEDADGNGDGIYVAKDPNEALYYAEGWSDHLPCWIIPNDQGPADQPRAPANNYRDGIS
jgi:hypothetical protein